MREFNLLTEENNINAFKKTSIWNPIKFSVFGIFLLILGDTLGGQEVLKDPCLYNSKKITVKQKKQMGLLVNDIFHPTHIYIYIYICGFAPKIKFFSRKKAFSWFKDFLI